MTPLSAGCVSQCSHPKAPPVRQYRTWVTSGKAELSYNLAQAAEFRRHRRKQNLRPLLSSGSPTAPQNALPNTDVVVLIPAFNEAGTIRDLVTRVLRIAPRVIVVDDGSTDATSREVSGLPVTLLRNERNLGKAASLWRGFDHALAAGARCIITLDGDGQHRPEDITALLAASERFPRRIVIGARLHDKNNFPARRYYANQFARFWISWAAGYPIADTQTGFRIYPATLFQQVSRRDVAWNGFVFESEILIAAGQRGIGSVAVSIPGLYPKEARPSHFRPVKDIMRIVLMVAGRLLRRGMYPVGLWRSLNLPMALEVPSPKITEGIGEKAIL
jgi:glycosyltransferase involved in cell wall biosynthesis